MSELYIPPERFERDFITGRFLKGCVSRNKGRKMVYHSKRSKARSIKNLSKGRGAWHKTGAGMNKKSVVLIKDEKLCGVFPSIQMAGKMIGVAPSLISAICRKVRGKHTANGYRCFFEDSNEVNMDNCRRFIKSLEEEKLSPATIRLRITAIERFSKWLKKPIELKRPKIKRKLDVNNVPTEEEYNRLLEYLKAKNNKDYYFFIKVLGTTGASVGIPTVYVGRHHIRGSDIKRKG